MLKWLKLLPQWAWYNFTAMLYAPYLATCYELRAGPTDNNNGWGVEPRLLPKWSMYATPDNSLLGDTAWKSMSESHWAWRSLFVAYPALQAYLGRLGWLWRNPAYGFEQTVLHAILDPTLTPIVKGNPFIQDKPNGVAGVCRVQIGEYWNYNAVIKLGSRCIKLNLGWKLKTFAEDPSRLAKTPFAPYAVGVGLKSFEVRTV